MFLGTLKASGDQIIRNANPNNDNIHDNPVGDTLYRSSKIPAPKFDTQSPNNAAIASMDWTRPNIFDGVNFCINNNESTQIKDEPTHRMTVLRQIQV